MADVSLISSNSYQPWFKYQILLQGIFDATNMVIYHDVTTEKWEKKKFLDLVSRFPL